MIKSDMLKNKIGKAGQQALISVSAIIVSLVLSMILVKYMDIDPLLAFKNMLSGSLGNKNAVAETIVKMTPLLFTGMSYAIANRCGLTNLGMEGQLYIGALSATAIAAFVQGLPAFLHLPLALIAGYIGGGFWGWFAGYLKVKSGASEIITTVMMNTIAINFAAFMVAGPMAEPTGFKTQTPAILETAKLPKIIEGTRAHMGFLIALLFIIML